MSDGKGREMKAGRATSHDSPVTGHAVAGSVPDLGYQPVPDIFRLPQGINFGPCSSVAVNSKGNLLVFNRSAHALMEFSGKGKYLRSLAEGVFSHPHGLRVDAEDNIWATDGVLHIVVKMNRQGRILMVLGVKGSAREWHPAGHLRCFDEPNDLAFGRAGEIYVTQGHGKGESRVLKFDAEGKFIKTWGGEGSGPGQFNVPHSIVADANGYLHVADRSNQRIQVFDADGNYVRESKHPGTPCGLCMSEDRGHVFLAHGHAGKIMRLDLDGRVRGATGGQGKALGQYGEAHFLALARRDREIYVADTLNWRVQKLVKQ
ncbi:MAG: 6-bladed beta-propeller [Betaproteobacteria bacterium]|nr:6-bladed beta-propeller [Betaproteobacteria bacterium]